MMRHVAANALTLLILGLVVLFGIVTWVQSQYRGRGAARPAPLDFQVERGEGLASVADRLAEAGAISSASVFRIAARYSDLDAGLRFGEYSIPAGASMREILELLNRGGNVLRQVVVPEGLTSWQVVELLKGQDGLSGEVAEVPAEGSLAPAGYDFQRGDERTALLARMEERQREMLAAAWAGRAADLPLRVARGASDAGVDRGEGDRRRRGAAAGGAGLRQPAGAGDAAADRPDGDLRHHQGGGDAGAGAAGERAGDGDALQHLCLRGAAAGADRQSRRGGDRGGGQSRAGGLSSISWPTGPAGTPSRGRWRSTTATWRCGGGSRRGASPRSGRRRRRPRRRPPPRRRGRWRWRARPGRWSGRCRGCRTSEAAAGSWSCVPSRSVSCWRCAMSIWAKVMGREARRRRAAAGRV